MALNKSHAISAGLDLPINAPVTIIGVDIQAKSLSLVKSVANRLLLLLYSMPIINVMMIYSRSLVTYAKRTFAGARNSLGTPACTLAKDPMSVKYVQRHSHFLVIFEITKEVTAKSESINVNRVECRLNMREL